MGDWIYNQDGEWELIPRPQSYSVYSSTEREVVAGKDGYGMDWEYIIGMLGLIGLGVLSRWIILKILERNDE